jgi:hypothetical protein
MKPEFQDVLIVGVDPASGKGSSVFYFEPTKQEVFYEPKYGPEELEGFLREIRDKYQRVLLAWDAPLTGTGANYQASQTQRLIETFLNKKEIKKVGANTQGYAGLSHWVISRKLLGLPRVGKFDMSHDSLPFRLIFKREKLRDNKNCVVEVHPALALAYLLPEMIPYKSGNVEHRKKAVKANFLALSTTPFFKNLQQGAQINEVKDDDHLDAFIAYGLAYNWLHSDQVIMLNESGEKDGGLLMPIGFEFSTHYSKFVEDPVKFRF